MDLSVCGIDCQEACIECNKHLQEPCKGCNAIKGEIFWTQYLGLDTCPIYNCCINEKHYNNCGECDKLPCEIYFSTKDPSTTDEEFLESIKVRANTLKQVNQKNKR